MKNFGINRAILIYSILMVAIVNNLFFSGGRVGVLALIVLLGLLCVQRLPFRAWQSALCGLALGVAIITLGYLGNEHFSQRFDKGIDEALNYQQRVNTSVGIRINMLVNSSRAFAQAPLLGAGSGDFSSTYRLINEQFSPQWSTTTNPHNQFLLVGVTTGMFGLVALLLVYYPGILRRLQVHKDSDNRHDLRVALAVWITVISLFESYLWRSNTCLLFIAFTCLAYGNSSRTDSVRQVTHVQ